MPLLKELMFEQEFLLKPTLDGQICAFSGPRKKPKRQDDAEAEVLQKQDCLEAGQQKTKGKEERSKRQT